MNKKILFPIFLYIISLPIVFAQKPNDYIILSGSKFTYPIIEKWISEYKKVNPLAHIKIQYQKQKTDSVNLRIIAHTPENNSLNPGETYIEVNRYALLPVANEQNLSLKKAFKKGLWTDDFKKIFFIDSLAIFDVDPDQKQKITVYAPIDQSSASIAFANHFGYKPSKIKGKKISGDEKYLISAIKRDSAGITFNSPGNIFDIQSRLLLPGIKLIPVDANDNGKLDEDEKIIANLDELNTLLESSSQNSVIPTENVGFIKNKNNNNALLDNFIQWVLNEGQRYNHVYGFLNQTGNSGALAQNKIDNK
jgi:phosphate transport system substrate-binding protein